jgi:hypothetical protein
MKDKNKGLLVSAIAAAIGGGLGAVSGSASLFVVFLVGAVSAAIVAWIISGMIR